MPVGVYIRTKKHCEAISRARLQSTKAKAQIKVIQKLPRSLAQLEASSKNGLANRGSSTSEEQKKAASKRMTAYNKSDAGKEHNRKLLKILHELPKTEAQIESARKSISELHKLPITKETKRKKRIAALNRIQIQIGEGGQIQPRFNSEACKHFDALNGHLVSIGYPIGQHATNEGEHYVKELGYFLDYFNPSLKLIIEWDEPKHYDSNGHLNPKDTQRQKEIQELFPDFEFVRMPGTTVINEERAILGLAPVDWGETPYSIPKAEGGF